MTSHGHASEHPVYIPCGPHHLFGIVSVPAEPNGAAALLLGGAGSFPSSGSNRFRAKVARRLAAHGYHSLRLDRPGAGESTGERAPANLYDPDLTDVRAALDWLRAQGFERFLLYGQCFGARLSIDVSPQVENVEAVIVLAPPARDVPKLIAKSGSAPMATLARRFFAHPGRYLFTRRGREALIGLGRHKVGQTMTSKQAQEGASWTSDRFLERFGSLVERRIPVLVCYGDQDEFYPDWAKASEAELKPLLSADTVEYVLIEGRTGVTQSVASQEDVMSKIDAWVGHLRSTERTSALEAP